MAAFHSDDAFDRLKTLPKVKGKEIVEPNAVTKNFRAFRKELVRAGRHGRHSRRDRDRREREVHGWEGGREGGCMGCGGCWAEGSGGVDGLSNVIRRAGCV